MVMVRQAGQRDVEKIFAIINGNLDDYFSPDVINFFMMQWPGGQFIAEDIFGNPLGAICGSRLDGGRAAISLFAVSSMYRNQGVGTQLLEYFRRRCMMDGYPTIQLEVRTTNTNAIRFYERHGFVRTEHLPHFYNDGGDGYRMVSGTPGISLTSF